MSQPIASATNTHVVDILGNVKGRDQPILVVEKALTLISMLDKQTLIDDNTIFIDPFCKAGEILLACALCRAIYSNKQSGPIASLQSLKNDLYWSSRYFGIAPDARHHKLSLRTFLGNKKSHQSDFSKIIRNGDYLSEIDGRLDTKKFIKELDDMISFIQTETKDKRIVAIGNPPYQESDGGHNKSAKPIYNFFVDTLMKCDSISEFILVIPSRWFSGGKGLKKFRENLLLSRKIKSIRTFKDPREVFPTVDINGGICFLHIDKDGSEKCEIIDGDKKKQVQLDKLDAIPDDIYAYELISKIKQKASNFMSEYVMPRNPFGITSTSLRNRITSDKQTIDCLIKERKRIKISRKLVLKNHELIDKFKVAVPKTVGGTKAVRDFLPIHQFFIVEPGVVFSETYLVLGSFENEEDARKFMSYLHTTFCRFLIGLRKLTQQLPSECWSWVPVVDFTQYWDDKKLSNFFELTDKESEYIKQKVEEWS